MKLQSLFVLAVASIALLSVLLVGSAADSSDAGSTQLGADTLRSDPDPAGLGAAASQTTTVVPATTTTVASATTTTTVASATTTTTVASATTTTVAPEGVAGFDSSAESQFVSLINNLRASVGAPALAHARDLQSHAQRWSKHMAESGEFEHSNLNSVPGPWSSVAENIAVNLSVRQAFDSLVSSSGHYANMVSPNFTEIGSGVWTDADGKLWVTHVFRG